jgi:hypothetical protein
MKFSSLADIFPLFIFSFGTVNLFMLFVNVYFMLLFHFSPFIFPLSIAYVQSANQMATFTEIA